MYLAIHSFSDETFLYRKASNYTHTPRTTPKTTQKKPQQSHLLRHQTQAIVSKYLRKDNKIHVWTDFTAVWGSKTSGKINILGTEEIEQFTISFTESNH